MPQGVQGLLEGRYRLAVGRTCGCLDASLPAVHHGLVPYLTSQGMLSKPFRLLGQTVGIEPFHGFNYAGVQGTPLLAQKAAVGHVMGEGMLEGVFQLRKELRLIDELRGLQTVESEGEVSA